MCGIPGTSSYYKAVFVYLYLVKRRCEFMRVLLSKNIYLNGMILVKGIFKNIGRVQNCPLVFVFCLFVYSPF